MATWNLHISHWDPPKVFIFHNCKGQYTNAILRFIESLCAIRSYLFFLSMLFRSGSFLTAAPQCSHVSLFSAGLVLTSVQPGEFHTRENFLFCPPGYCTKQHVQHPT